jgi:hypothetical protein
VRHFLDQLEKEQTAEELWHQQAEEQWIKHFTPN